MIEKKFVSEGILNVQISKFLEERLNRANIVNVDVQKTALVSRVSITAEKPGMVIGKKGTSIDSLTKELEKRFGLTSPQLEVKGLEENPDLNAQIVAKRIAEQLERRGAYKPLLVKSVQRIMESGARGCEVVIKGALIGKGGKALKVSKIEGYVKKVGDMTKIVSRGKAIAKTKKGTIGVQVRILPPGTVFIDKEDITKFLPLQEAVEKKTEEAKPEAETQKEAPAAQAGPPAEPEPAKEPIEEKPKKARKKTAEEPSEEKPVEKKAGGKKKEGDAEKPAKTKAKKEEASE
ncbi:MAG TPA: 30S ribosomal protein S3 [archaeon]|nr:30S ribosomal protein S3 [archaeon]